MDTDETTYLVEPDKQRLNGRLVFAFFACVVGSSFVFGIHTGVVNLPQTKIEQFLNETEIRRTGHSMVQSKITLLWAIIVSIWAIGGMVGGVNAGYFAEKLGRKKCLLANNALTFFAAALIGFSKLASSYEMLIIGRFFAGIQCGISTGVAPLYLSEIAPLRLRGAAGTLNQLAIVLGVLLSQIIGMDFVLGTEKFWPLLLSFPAFPAALQLLTFSFCPESPKYLYIKKNDHSAAIRALQWLRCGDGFDEELEDMQSQEENGDNAEKLSICGVLTTKWLRRPLFISVIMQLSQQLSGINAVIYYSTQIFRKTAHLNQTASQLASIGVSGVNLIITGISASIVDKTGRRTLHLIGLAGMFCAASALTTSFLWEARWHFMSYLAIVSTILFVCFFAIGPGAIPWFIVAEMFSQSTRPAAVSLAVLTNWFANFLVGLCYPLIQDAIKVYSFVPFVVFLGIFWIIIYLVLPETKGKTTDEITNYFRISSNNSGLEASVDPVDN